MLIQFQRNKKERLCLNSVKKIPGDISPNTGLPGVLIRLRSREVAEDGKLVKLQLRVMGAAGVAVT